MLFVYSLAVDLDGIISKFEATFPSEIAANDFADIMRDFIVEFSFVQQIEPAYSPPF